MKTFTIVLLVILVILIVACVALYFVGKKAEKKQADQQAQLDAVAQTVSILVIDKGRSNSYMNYNIFYFSFIIDISIKYASSAISLFIKIKFSVDFIYLMSNISESRYFISIIYLIVIF